MVFAKSSKSTCRSLLASCQYAELPKKASNDLRSKARVEAGLFQYNNMITEIMFSKLATIPYIH